MIKRALDIILSLLTIVVLSVVLIPILIILKCTGEHEIFYVQERLKKGGKPFGLLKFATMLKNSPNIGNGYITVPGDPRVLPFGRFLRKTKINELPQIFNIFLGDISIVGPRPLVKKHVEFIPEEYRQDVLDIKPGLTGIGSIVFRDEESIFEKYKETDPSVVYKEKIAPYKAQLELWYKKKQSLLVDSTIILLTAWVIFFPESQLHYKVFKTLPERPKELII